MFIENKILPVLVIHDQKKAIDLAKCLYDSVEAPQKTQNV